jgi:hypothetical protein
MTLERGEVKSFVVALELRTGLGISTSASGSFWSCCWVLGLDIDVGVGKQAAQLPLSS